MKHNKEKKLKEDKKNKKEPKTLKKRFIKFIIFVLILTILASICYLLYKAYTFKTLAKEMFNNSTSTVFDSNKNVIAEIGSERNKSNSKLSEIPDNLKNAYISIEDQRFY